MVGETISHYKITAKLGEGGMGVVYKAEDTKLERPVALKFLAPHLVLDEEIRKRFKREAQAAAALNHPNICTVYEIDDPGGQTFIAMELVEGPSIADKIKERPLPLDESLDIAIQVANGLQASHEKGVVHRDIKSANILLTPLGQVKITDFGLAHLAERSRLTKSGSTMGTPAFMSPEQAQNLPANHRTDIWSLGVMLYEMLTGRLPFDGQYEQAVIYSIINEDPEPVTALRAGVPMELEFITGKCLEKEPGSRYQHASELAVDLRNLRDKLKSGRSTIRRDQVVGQRMTQPPVVATQSAVDPLVRYHVIEELEDSHDSARYLAEDTQLHRSVSIRVLPQSSAELIERRQRRKQTIVFGIGALGWLLAMVFVFVALFSLAPMTESPLRRFAQPIDGPPVQSVAISPDGRHIVYTAGRDEFSFELWIWDLDRLEPRKIETGGPVGYPFWSPNSDFVAFRLVSKPEIRKVSIHGGASSTICSVGLYYFGGAWNPDGNSIVFSSFAESGPLPKLYEVSAQGGTAKPLTDPDEPQDSGRFFPQFLPGAGGNRSLVFAQGTSAADTKLVLLDPNSNRREILTPGDQPVYSPTGHIIYSREDTLWALPFSTKSLRATGEPFPVVGSALYPSVSRDGTLVYLRRATPGLMQLTWRNRGGQKLGTIGTPQPRIQFPVLSPDGSQVVVRAVENDNTDIWVHEVARSLKRRLTFDPAMEDRPTWTPKGDKISFSSLRNGDADVFIKPANGSGEDEPLLTDPAGVYGYEWSEDGKYLVGSGGGKLWYLQAQEGGGYEKAMFLDTPFDALSPSLSADAKFLAYESNESGRYEVYVQPFPHGGTKWQVSTNGGGQPRWRGDGKEIFYVEGNRLMAVPVTTGAAFSAGGAEPLFEDTTAFDGRGQSYDVTPDGQRFVTVGTIDDAGAGQEIHVVENWFEEFRGRQKN